MVLSLYLRGMSNNVSTQKRMLVVGAGGFYPMSVSESDDNDSKLLK